MWGRLIPPADPSGRSLLEPVPALKPDVQGEFGRPSFAEIKVSRRERRIAPRSELPAAGCLIHY
jgi:hypothetical protein